MPRSITRAAWNKCGQSHVHQGESGIEGQADFVGGSDNTAREFAMTGVGLTMQHYTFYDFIINKARGKSGPLFNFDVHDDVRMVSDANVEKDEVIVKRRQGAFAQLAASSHTLAR